MLNHDEKIFQLKEDRSRRIGLEREGDEETAGVELTEMKCNELPTPRVRTNIEKENRNK